MKIDVVKTLIVAIFAILISVLFFEIVDNPEKSLALFLAVGITTALFGIPAVGVKYDFPRTGVSIKTLMICGVVLSYILNYAFSFFDFKNSIFIAINGIFVLIVLLIAISIFRTNQ